MNLIAVAAAFFAFLRFVIVSPAIRAGAISVRPPRNSAAAQCAAVKPAAEVEPEVYPDEIPVGDPDSSTERDQP